MKIARLVESNSETYGFVKDGHVSTKDEITFETGVPIPQSIKDFLFDGWYDEVMNKISRLPYKEIPTVSANPKSFKNYLFSI